MILKQSIHLSIAYVKTLWNKAINQLSKMILVTVMELSKTTVLLILLSLCFFMFSWWTLASVPPGFGDKNTKVFGSSSEELLGGVVDSAHAASVDDAASDDEFIEAATALVNAIANYKPNTAKERFESVLPDLVEPARGNFQREVLGSQLKEILSSSTGQLFKLIDSYTEIERHLDRNQATVHLVGKRTLLKKRRPVKRDWLSYKVSLHSKFDVRREERRIVVTGVWVRTADNPEQFGKPDNRNAAAQAYDDLFTSLEQESSRLREVVASKESPRDARAFLTKLDRLDRKMKSCRTIFKRTSPRTPKACYHEIQRGLSEIGMQISR
jgi:hypothetical protein